MKKCFMPLFIYYFLKRIQQKYLINTSETKLQSKLLIDYNDLSAENKNTQYTDVCS